MLWIFLLSLVLHDVVAKSEGIHPMIVLLSQKQPERHRHEHYQQPTPPTGAATNWDFSSTVDRPWKKESLLSKINKRGGDGQDPTAWMHSHRWWRDHKQKARTSAILKDSLPMEDDERYRYLEAQLMAPSSGKEENHQEESELSNSKEKEAKKEPTKCPEPPRSLLNIAIDEDLRLFLSNMERCIVRIHFANYTLDDLRLLLPRMLGDNDPPQQRIVLHVGSSDVKRHSPYRTAQEYRMLLDTLTTRYPNSALVISSLLPFPESVDPRNQVVFSVNEDIEHYCTQVVPRCKFINHLQSGVFSPTDRDFKKLFVPNTLDLNSRGKELLANAIKESVNCKAVTSFECSGKSRDEMNTLELKDILPFNPKQYDKNRPPKQDGHPTIVDFHVTVLGLDSIDEESMTYIADIFLAQTWRDPRLRLPENMTSEYRILDVDWLKFIWRPDTFFKNAKLVTFHLMTVPNHYLWLYHDKTLLYMTKLSLVMSCAMKFEAYPHDSQVCSMMIESLSHTTQDLVFRWNITSPLVVNSEIELPQSDIISNVTGDCTLSYSTGNFTCLSVAFTLKRRLGYHLFHTYIPTSLIVVMSWISFWIKPEAIPARVTLGVTALLTIATQNKQSQSSLPPVSYVKAIDVWMSACTVFVFASLMEFAVVNNFMGPVATKPMKGFTDDDIAAKAQEPCDEDGVPSGRSSWTAYHQAPLLVLPQYDLFCNGRAVALIIDKFSRMFFPMSFIVLNIVYWYIFLPD